MPCRRTTVVKRAIEKHVDNPNRPDKRVIKSKITSKGRTAEYHMIIIKKDGKGGGGK